MATFQDGRHQEPVQHFNKIEIGVLSGNVELSARHKEGTNRRAAIACRSGPPYVFMNRRSARRSQFVIIATTACVLHVDTFPLTDTHSSIRLIDDNKDGLANLKFLGQLPATAPPLFAQPLYRVAPAPMSLTSTWPSTHRIAPSSPARPPPLTSRSASCRNPFKLRIASYLSAAGASILRHCAPPQPH